MIIFLYLLVHGQICDSSSGDYVLGDNIPVCLHFSTGLRVAFQPQLDKYSAIQAKGAFNQLLNSNTTEVFLQIQSGNTQPSDRLPYIYENLVAPIMNVVIRVDEGAVDEVILDTNCDLCDEKCLKHEGEEVCAQNFCSTEEGEDCDPKVFISWIGTDADGNHMLSAGFRMSQFRKYSLYNNYEEAKQDFD